MQTNQNLTDSVSLCFTPLSCFLWVLYLYWWVHYSSSPPLYPGVLLRIGLVLIVAQKSLLMTLHGNVEEFASVYEREWELFSLLPAFFSVCFFPPPQSPHEVSCRLHLVFISRHFLAAFKTQSGCVCVCVGGAGGEWRELGPTSLVDTAGVDLAPQWCRKGRAAPAAMLKGVAEINGRPLSLFHIFWLVQWAA